MRDINSKSRGNASHKQAQLTTMHRECNCKDKYGECLGQKAEATYAREEMYNSLVGWVLLKLLNTNTNRNSDRKGDIWLYLVIWVLVTYGTLPV